MFFFHGTVTRVLSSRGLGWGLYLFLVATILLSLLYILLAPEPSSEYFNRDFRVFTKKGKTYIQYEHGRPQPTVRFRINNIDYLNKTLDCTLKIERFNQLILRSVQVLSWDWPDRLKLEGVGPDAEVYFLLPSEKEIYETGLRDREELESSFRFRVSGNPVMYPFDRYRVESSIDILHVPTTMTAVRAGSETPRRAEPLGVTTFLEENLPGFFISAPRDSLTFQKEAVKTGILSKNAFSFVLLRGRFLRYFTVYIYGVAAVYLLYIAFRKDVREVLGQALGYFAALWGIKNIITARVDVFPTLVDYSTLALYSMLILIVMARLLHAHYSGNT